MLLEKLKSIVGKTLYEQAVSHYKSGNVISFANTPQGNSRYQIKAIVKASGAYGVNLILDLINDRLKMDNYCTCSAGNNQVCVHAATVVYKFIADDLPKLHPELIKPTQPEDIELLKQVVAGSFAKIELQYEIANLDNFDDFKITISAGDREDFIRQLLDCLGDINYSARKRESLLNSLTGMDLLVFTFLENVSARKDPGQGAVFLPQSLKNLQLILTLIAHDKAYSGSHPLKLGEILKPRISISGDETRLELSYNLAEFQSLGFINYDLKYVLAGETLHTIDNSCLEKLPSQVLVPPEQLGEVLFETLPQLAERYPLDLSPKFAVHRLELNEPEFSLFFDYQDGRIICRPEIKLLDRIYQGAECFSLLARNFDYSRSQLDPQQWLAVNRKPFQDLGEFFQRYRFRFDSGEWVIEELEYILKMALNGLTLLPPEWSVTTGSGYQNFRITPVSLEPVVTIAMDDKIDWFDFEIYYNLGGKTYSHQEIQAMLRRTGAGSFIQAGDSWFLIQNPSKAEFLEKTFSTASIFGPTTEKAWNIVYLRRLLSDNGIEIKGNSVYNRFEADISRTNLIETFGLPGGLQGELRSYQKEGFYWLRFLDKYHFGGILADDMGLGKTLQVLTLIKSIPKENPVLVVSPLSLIYNWVAEIQKFYPGTSYLVYHGQPEFRETLLPAFQQHEIIITTYDIVVNDIEMLQNHSFYLCVLDEAQHIKNQQTMRAREVKKINSRHRLVLTGTPIENRLEDLWSLFDFLMPGYLGNQSEFKEQYVLPLKKTNQLEIINMLRQKIAPFMLRRLKENVLTELPPKIISQRHILMSQLQEDIYRTVLKEVKQEVINSVTNYGLEKSKITVLAALTKLRQICDHPSLAIPEIAPDADSGKIDALLELINETIDSGHKMVIFSQFVRMLKLIRGKLQENGINHIYLDGSTTDRMERINCFNNTPEIPVFLISLKAGGVGINLTSADIVVHTDPWWNPMVENQATDRVHRIGQQKQVMVYRLITIGTIEEKLVQLQQRKRTLFEAVVNENDNPVNSLTWEDIRELFDIDPK